jgi:hypothetical protein
MHVQQKKRMTQDPQFPYLNVSYFENMRWTESRHQHYPLVELERVFKQAIQKLTDEKRQALICHRSSDHQLIKSYAVNLDESVNEKKKVVRGR